MQQHRPSILHRPQRANASRANEETYESQYQREQAALRAKQEKQEETRQRLIRSLHPQPEDKAAQWEAMVASNSVLASRHARPEREEAPLPSDNRGPVPEGIRPWHHSLSTQQYTAADEDAARRRYAAEVAAENQRMARERELRRAMEEQAKHEPLQDTWYQRGETHQRAQPLFSGSGVPVPAVPTGYASPAACQRPASAYPWATTDQQAAAWQAQQGPSMAAAPQPLQRLPANYPWTWETSGGEAVRPQTASAGSAGSAAPQRSQPAYPWATTTGDAMVLVRPTTALPQPKLPEKQYPWSWQT